MEHATAHHTGVVLQDVEVLLAERRPGLLELYTASAAAYAPQPA